MRRVRTEEENDEHAKDLKHEPAIAGYTGVVFEQFALGAAYVVDDVHDVIVDALHCFALFGDHVR